MSQTENLLNPHRIGLTHQHGCHFIVSKHHYGYHNIMCICPRGLNHKAWHFQGGEKSKENGSYESHDSLQPLICTWINVKRLHDKHTWSHNMARTNKPNRQPSIINMTVWILKNQFTLYKITFPGICKGGSRDKSLSSKEIYHVTITGSFKYMNVSDKNSQDKL